MSIVSVARGIVLESTSSKSPALVSSKPTRNEMNVANRAKKFNIKRLLIDIQNMIWWCKKYINTAIGFIKEKCRIRFRTCVQTPMHRFSFKKIDYFYRSRKQRTAEYWQLSELLVACHLKPMDINGGTTMSNISRTDNVVHNSTIIIHRRYCFDFNLVVIVSFK